MFAIEQALNQKTMKKLIFLASFVFAIFTTHAIAGDADLFNLNEDQINAEFAGLNELEQFVMNHEGITLSQLKECNNALALNLNLTNNGIAALTMISGEPPLGIPSFIWGCVLGWVGILVTYLVTDDKEETLKSLWGCLVQGVTGVVFYVIFFVVLVSSAF